MDRHQTPPRGSRMGNNNGLGTQATYVSPRPSVNEDGVRVNLGDLWGRLRSLTHHRQVRVPNPMRPCHFISTYSVSRYLCTRGMNSTYMLFGVSPDTEPPTFMNMMEPLKLQTGDASSAVKALNATLTRTALHRIVYMILHSPSCCFPLREMRSRGRGTLGLPLPRFRSSSRSRALGKSWAIESS